MLRQKTRQCLVFALASLLAFAMLIAFSPKAEAKGWMSYVQQGTLNKWISGTLTNTDYYDDAFGARADYYRIKLPSAGKLTIYTNGTDPDKGYGSYPRIYIYNSSTKLVNWKWYYYANYNSAYDYHYNSTSLSAGTYYIGISGGSDRYRLYLGFKSSSVPMTNFTLYYAKKIPLGNTGKFYIVKHPSNTTDKNRVTWRSSNPKVATIDSNGKVTTKSMGTTTITASCSGQAARAQVTVTRRVPRVNYQTHVQTYGWQGWRSNGATSGTSGQSKRLEGIKIKISNLPYSGGVTYRTHVQTYGWQGWRSNGATSGTTGKRKRLEAIQVKLTGNMARYYDVYYRVHAQHFGWMGWAKNGGRAGTAGYSYRLEAIQIKLVPKGSKAPGSTRNAFRQR